jgi:hypothetical protein
LNREFTKKKLKLIIITAVLRHRLFGEPMTGSLVTKPPNRITADQAKTLTDDDEQTKQKP